MPDLTSTTVTTSTLKVAIVLENTKKVNINIPDPVEGLTKAQLETPDNEKGFVGYIISESLINKGGYMATGSDDPYYYTTEKIIMD